MKPIPGHVASAKTLRSHRISAKARTLMVANLFLFPTPFKGIYYVPLDDERKGWLLQNPALALREALAVYLKTDKFYYSCRTADEYHGISWHPSGEMHVVNAVRSGKIDLEARIGRNRQKKTWRAKTVARILEFYCRKIIFHKGEVEGAKLKRTPYGDFALPSQIKKDRKRFREKTPKY